MDKDKSEIDEIKHFFQKITDFKKSGVGYISATELAELEMRINQWPKEWGNNLEVIIYGSFMPPPTELQFDTLGITVYPEQLKNFCIKSAPCALKTKVEVHEKNVDSFIDAIRRIGILLGTSKLTVWGNTCCGWWCWLLHNVVCLDRIEPFPSGDIKQPIDHIIKLNNSVRQKIEAALYWITYSNSPLTHYRNDVLIVYSAYWNAFECLVDAINISLPRKNVSKNEKKRQINNYIKSHSGEYTLDDIQKLYRIVDPGFVAKASHALRVCFGKNADKCITQFFENKNGKNFYDIRNKIDHGDIDAYHYKDLALITEKQYKLLVVVWYMFRYIIPPLCYPEISSTTT